MLADGPVPVTELRAAVIIGSGSASFEMLRSLVEILPAMVTPKWVSNRCQPIAIRDVLFYLVAVLDHPEAAGRVLEVGGTDVLTYEEMMRTYARVAGLRRRVIQRVPVLSPTLSSRWVGLVTPLPTGPGPAPGREPDLEVYVDRNPISEVVDHQPVGFERGPRAGPAPGHRPGGDHPVVRCLAARPHRRRSPARPTRTGPAGRCCSTSRRSPPSAPPEAVFATVEGIGGDRGWYVTPFLWGVAGHPRQAGRRGRHAPGPPPPRPHGRGRRRGLLAGRGGRAAPSLIRLRAEMRLPGEAWLEWRIDTDDGATRVRQRALFHPRGLARPGLLVRRWSRSTC